MDSRTSPPDAWGVGPTKKAELDRLFDRLLVPVTIEGRGYILKRLAPLLRNVDSLLPPRCAGDIERFTRLLPFADHLPGWTHHDANLLKNRVSELPLLALLLTNPPPDPEDSDRPHPLAPQLKLLQQIAIAAHITGDRVPLWYRQRLDDAVAQFRYAHDLAPDRLPTVGLLPTGPFGLRKLFEHRHAHPRLRASEGVKAYLPLLRACERLTDHILFFGEEFLHRAASSVENESESSVVVSASPADGGEAEDVSSIRVPGGERGAELSEDAISFAKNDAIFAATQWHSANRSRPAVMDPVEVRNLRTLIFAMLGGAADGITTLVMTLMVALGLSADEVLDLRFGIDGDLTPRGIMKRFVLLPEDGFRTAPEVADAYVGEHTDVVEIELPRQVRDLLGSVLGDRGGITLRTALGLEAKKVEKIKYDIGRLVRRDVGKRLDITHLRRVLKHRVTEMTQDPIAACLVTGSAVVKPPVTLAYRVIRVDWLRAAHASAIAELFGEPARLETLLPATDATVGSRFRPDKLKFAELVKVSTPV